MTYKMKHKFIVDHMTLEEKASLMSGADFWHTKAVGRLGIPSAMMSDGPHGLRKQGGKGDNLGLGKSVPATCYPTAAGLANSWDETLLEELGRFYGAEAVSEKVSMVLGPGVNIKRSPLCGRNFEYFSEDPFLAGKMAAAMIRGLQSQGIYACVKHFAANSQELRRMTADSVVDERTLREIYLTAFEIAVKEGGVKAVMTSYNRLNGVYAGENEHLLRDILYNEWNFDGIVVSDWGATNDRAASLKAGMTLEMPYSGGGTDKAVAISVRSGELEESLLDEQIDRLLSFVFDTAKAHDTAPSCDRAEHHFFARRAAEETAVLLKNEGNILPIEGKERSVAVIGAFAEKPRYQGAGSSKIVPTLLDTALEALPMCGMNIKGYAPGFEKSGRPNEKLIAEAVELAASADTALLYLGLDDKDEVEGEDREHMRLPENQLELLKAVAEANKNVVVVLSCGCSVEMQWRKYARGIIHGYLGGQGGAMAMARLLTGKANPSGKLAESIPLNLAAVPCGPYYPGLEATAEYREGIYVGYRYYNTAKVPSLYPFGFGLSYTSFAYSDIRLEGDSVFFKVKNTGSRPGAEVAQLYIAAHTGGMFRPEKELKGFVRLTLAPGEEKEAEIKLCDRSFAVWSASEKRWVTENGKYEVLVGASSTDIRLSLRVEKPGEPTENPYSGEIFAPYYSADVLNISDECFSALLGHKIPRAKWRRYEKLGVNDNISQGEYLKKGLGRPIYSALKSARDVARALGDADSASNISFLMNMPYRAVGRMSRVLDDRQTNALMKLINGEDGGTESFIEATKARKSEK